MRFLPTPLLGAYLIELELKEDERGFFARSYCHEEFVEHGLNSDFVQCNISYNKTKGTLRGMHFQKAPHEEVKVVRCTQGAIFDVIIDIRPKSATFRHWHGVELTSSNRLAYYVPGGFAHGFLTLEGECEVLYQMSTSYSPDAASGVRWNDPAFGIPWPEQVRMISERDSAYPDFVP